MSPTETEARAALDAALARVGATLAESVSRLLLSLGARARDSARLADRDALNAAQFELRRHAAGLQRAFAESLGEAARQSADTAVPRRRTAAPDWQTLTLVDDDEVEERMVADRIAQSIGHAAEAEWRELCGYTAALLGADRADAAQHPLRAEALGVALCRGIDGMAAQPPERDLLRRELAAALAQAMPACYAAIVADLHQRGLSRRAPGMRPLHARRTEPAESRFAADASQPGTLDSRFESQFDSGIDRASPDAALLREIDRQRPGGSGWDERSSAAASRRTAFTESTDHASRSGTRTGSGTSTRSGTSLRAGMTMPSAGPAVQADARLMALLRHLTADASPSDVLDAAPPTSVAAARAAAASRLGAEPRRRDATAPLRPNATTDAPWTGAPSAATGSAAELTGLMAVNLIRAHRDELLQASAGKLDHMVIDVVGSLFDQILSDSRVPPQMARQIARLQLPVLRVALGDASFFSSRRHPVRRFVNRIASLACAFDDFDDGPGKTFLARVRELVQEIVDGDFDQIELYAAQLTALEAFIAEHTQAALRAQGTVATLQDKETELRLQQRYRLQLQAALQPLALPAYLAEFLPQVWSQALVLAVARDGADSERAKRYRRAGRDVVMSVQPKASPTLRKKFLMQLPTLRKDLTEGLALIGWPPAAQRAFFERLTAAHSESLQGQTQTELDHNLMAKQLESIFALPVPSGDALTAADAVPEVDAEVLATRFTPEEARRVGLVTESTVDWSKAIDIDLDSPRAGVAAAPAVHRAPPSRDEAGSATGPSTDGDHGARFSTGSSMDREHGARPSTGPSITGRRTGRPGDGDGIGSGAAGGSMNGAVSGGRAAPAAVPTTGRDSSLPGLLRLDGIDIDLSLADADPAEPARGARLFDHLKPGFAYQMYLKDQWQKVRLAHVSPGRSFFVFTRGLKHQESISMTARMLARMCESSRLRAVESAYLMERATYRARKQLAAIGAQARV